MSFQFPFCFCFYFFLSTNRCLCFCFFLTYFHFFCFLLIFAFRDFLNDTCVLRLTCVRAALVHVHIIALLSFSGSALQAQPCERVANSLFFFAGAITSLSVGEVGNCPISSSIGFALQPSRIASHPVAVTRHGKTYHGQSPFDCGQCVCGEPSAWSETDCDFLFNLVVGFSIFIGCTHCLFPREFAAAAEQIKPLPDKFFGSFVHLESLSMKLRGRAIPEPWPMTPVHSSLEMEASLLDSGVQEFLATEDSGAYGLTSNTLLQEVTLTVVGLFELNRSAVLVVAVGRGGDLSGAAQPSDSCGVNFSFFLPTSRARGNCFRGSMGSSSNFRQITAATHSFVGPLCGIDSRCLIKRRCRSAPNSRPCRSTCEIDYSSGQARKCTFTGGRVRSGSGCGNDESRAHRGFQRRRITREEAPAAWRPCSGRAHSLHPSWIQRIDHSRAQGERARRSDASSGGIRELGAPRRGVSSSPLWSSRKLACTGNLADGRIGGFECHHALP